MRRASVLAALALALAACSDDPPPDPTVCVPGDCSATGQTCGTRTDATGQCIICGKCTAPLTCGGGGQAGQCGCAKPVCGAEQCGQLQDRCGGPAVTCTYVCAADETCGGAGTDNSCGRQAALGEACGPRAVCGQGAACCGGTCVREGPDGECPRPGPDMTVEPSVVAPSFVIETKIVTPSDCAIADRCLPGPGTFRLLRFTTQTNNIGTADLLIGDPRTLPGDFFFAQCHGHNHYDGYTVYRLLDGAGREVTGGFKAGFCIEDTARLSPQAPANPKYFCDPEKGGIQGIQAGWADIYLAHLDCQWVNITSVPPGDYQLEIEVNPAPRRFHEASYDNNVVRVPVTIPPG